MFFPPHAVPMSTGNRVSGWPSGTSGSTSSAVSHDAQDSASNGTIVSHKQSFHIPTWTFIAGGAVAAVLAIVFMAAFIYHFLRERRLARTQNRKASIRSAAWKGLKVSLFFWVFAAISRRCLCGRKRKAGSTSYRKVDDAGEKTANNNTYVSSLGYSIAQPGPSSAAYGDGGSGNQEPSSARYEPYSNIGTKAVSVGGSNPTAPPYSPNSAFAFHQDTSYAPTTSSMPSSSPAHPPVHITPSVSPNLAAVSSHSAVTEPLIEPSSSATYIPGHDSHML